MTNGNTLIAIGLIGDTIMISSSNDIHESGAVIGYVNVRAAENGIDLKGRFRKTLKTKKVLNKDRELYLFSMVSETRLMKISHKNKLVFENIEFENYSLVAEYYYMDETSESSSPQSHIEISHGQLPVVFKSCVVRKGFDHEKHEKDDECITY